MSSNTSSDPSDSQPSTTESGPSSPNSTSQMNETQKETHQPSSEGTNRARKMTYYIFLVVFCLWLYSLWADRMTPMTDQGRINGQIVRIVPQISGPVSQVFISNNVPVKRDQLILTIDQKPFELDVKAARLALQTSTQTFNADSAAIDAAKANEVAARVKVDNARQHLARNRALAKQKVISQASLDDSFASLETAQANLAQATASLKKAQQALGPEGQNNPQIQTALNRLEQALLNLSYTQISAPANGVITNMNLVQGSYANQNQPLMTYINTNHLWLTAMVTENSLAHLKQGTPVKIVFDAYPGEIYQGKITSIGWGSSGNGGLQVDNSNGLLNSPTNSPKSQRFPVNIQLTDRPQDMELRYGGRAVISFYPGESYIGERLLDLWTWTWSYLSYVS